MSFSPSNQVFKIGGYDVSKYVLSLQNATGIYNKPEWGGMPSTPRLQFQLLNNNSQFSTFSDNSLLYNKTLQDLTLKMLYQQGSTEITEWNGYIENVQENYSTNRIDVFGISKFQQKLDLPALISSGVDTPSELSKAVFILFDIPYNTTSYNRADSLLSGLVSAQIDPNLVNSNINLYELQKLLATAGYGRIYNVNGEMHYEVFDSSSRSVSFTLYDRDLMTDPLITKEERQFTTYKVEYIDGSVDSTSFVSGDTPQQSLNFGVNSPVKITSQSAALQVADQWELISQLDQKSITFGVKHDIANQLNLTSFIYLSVPEIGIDETLEIVSIDKTDDKYATLTGRTI